MRYMLDTDICSYVIRKHPPELLRRFNSEAQRMCISSVTLAELLFGAENNRNYTKPVTEFTARIDVLDFETIVTTPSRPYMLLPP